MRHTVNPLPKRHRKFFCTLPPPSSLVAPRRPPPWDTGWIRLHHQPLPAMMRARNRPPDPPRHSTYQCHHEHLVYHTSSIWPHVPPQNLRKAIRDALPQQHQRGWDWITHPPNVRLEGCTEREAEDTAQYITNHYAALGLRPPSTTERAKIAGIYDYASSLNLTEHQLFNAMGNSFDKQAITIRIRDGLKQWIERRPVPQCRYPTPAQLRENFHHVRAEVIRAAAADRMDIASQDLATEPFPNDLVDPLTSGRFGDFPNSVAALGGRPPQ
jgi:hypothetical protein